MQRTDTCKFQVSRVRRRSRAGIMYKRRFQSLSQQYTWAPGGVTSRMITTTAEQAQIRDIYQSLETFSKRSAGRSCQTQQQSGAVGPSEIAAVSNVAADTLELDQRIQPETLNARMSLWRGSFCFCLGVNESSAYSVTCSTWDHWNMQVGKYQELSARALSMI